MRANPALSTTGRIPRAATEEPRPRAGGSDDARVRGGSGHSARRNRPRRPDAISYRELMAQSLVKELTA
jgi:hypothetical protein